MIEEKIYDSWAFSENEKDKGKMNRKIYNQLIEKYKVFRHDLKLNPDIDIEKYDVIIGREPMYHRSKYNIIKNSPNLTDIELLLLCDHGNLCFGGHRVGSYLEVFED
ncbi:MULTISPECIES: hypothetical protein [Listeria]|uniref:hypothetical protein n=1 Tax=Listeria TaxID=1637 RepID=UPI000F200C4F|nr:MULTISPECIES: hypothetical protein [Listeria]EJQ3348608.1 hypothetical protein [Listeria monocytogenes]EKB5536525.1 hypothetical protein [Listeria monocytogenes]MBC2038388.1 hypothetical protein [Listeria marthii]MBF2519830.1 hypothetical protein [Listeria marthii]MCD2240874.1 hypothetical protein [Listeria monocytogenes]